VLASRQRVSGSGGQGVAAMWSQYSPAGHNVISGKNLTPPRKTTKATTKNLFVVFSCYYSELFMGENGLKVLLTGDSGVGKSSVLVRFTDDHFDAE
jgi:hypothetical protein